MATWDKNCHSQPSIHYPFDVELFLLLLSGIGYQYLTKILGLGINIRPNFWDWVIAEILVACTPYEFIVKYLPWEKNMDESAGVNGGSGNDDVFKRNYSLCLN